MFIGDKSVWAIECEVTKTHENFVYCHFRFWFANEAIGDWQEESVLGVIAHSAKVFLRYSGERQFENFQSSSPNSVWQKIYRYINANSDEEFKIALHGHYRQRFLLHEIADDAIGSLVEVIIIDAWDNTQQILWKWRDSPDIRTLTLPKLSVDYVLADFVSWAESESKGVGSH